VNSWTGFAESVGPSQVETEQPHSVRSEAAVFEVRALAYGMNKASMACDVFKPRMQPTRASSR